MNKAVLTRLGLGEDEAEIYLSLINHPHQSLSDLSKHLMIHRPKLYQILPAMQELGLVSRILDGKRYYYRAENPEILRQYFHSLKADFDHLIPELQKSYQHANQHPVLKHFKGKQGIKNIFMDIAHSCQKGEVFYRYSSRTDVQNTSLAEKDYAQYRDIRNQKELQRYVITNEYLDQLKANKLDKEVVIIPPQYDLFEDNVTKIIYANKVAIIDYHTFESFVIESEAFAGFEKKLFRLLFQFLKKDKR